MESYIIGASAAKRQLTAKLSKAATTNSQVSEPVYLVGCLCSGSCGDGGGDGGGCDCGKLWKCNMQVKHECRGCCIENAVNLVNS